MVEARGGSMVRKSLWGRGFPSRNILLLTLDQGDSVAVVRVVFLGGLGVVDYQQWQRGCEVISQLGS